MIILSEVLNILPTQQYACTPGADWLYFSARAQFDQTGPQIVENVNQWAEQPTGQSAPDAHFYHAKQV